jgi:hypothetical protein
VNRAGRFAGPNANPSHAAAGALTRELQVGDRVLYRRGSVEMDQVGVIEAVENDHYWICTREGEAFCVRKYGQCVFYPPPWVIEQRAKAVRAAWYDAQLRQQMGLPLPANGGLSNDASVGAAADPHERGRCRSDAGAHG